jgi:hypothetical protein
MHLDSRYLAYRWLRRTVQGAIIVRAKAGDDDDASWQEFLRERYQGGKARVPNPHHDPFYRHLNPEVSFSTAYKYPEFRSKVEQEFAAWKGQSEDERGQKQSPQPSQGLSRDAALEVARDGEVVSKEPMGTGKTMNETFMVKLRHGDQEVDFVFKPWEGAQQRLRERSKDTNFPDGVSAARLGIEHEKQHLREAGAFQMDQMLFGDEGLVPPTVAREDGSYQQLAHGAKTMGLDFPDLVEAVPPAELTNHPGFQKLNVLDLIMGHQDRHRNNVMYYFDGDEKNAENLRFIAIDNGLSLANPDAAAEVEDYVYENPFQRYSPHAFEGAATKQPAGKTTEVPGQEDDWEAFDAEFADDKTKPAGQGRPEPGPGIVDGVQAQRKVMADIPKELHEQLKKTDPGKMASQLVESGVEESAARASAVRLAALQADPTIFGTFLEMTDNDLGDAWKEFQVWSGTMADQLLKTAGAPEKLKDINDALKARKPRQDEI